MSSIDLDRIEWQDLPLVALTVAATGVQLVVSVYDENACVYVGRGLQLTEADSLSFNMTGQVSESDLGSLRISAFSYSLSPEGLLTGTISILVGSSGFWEIAATDAQWRLAEA